MYFLLAKGIFILIGLIFIVLGYIIVIFRDFIFGRRENTFVPLENPTRQKRNAEYAHFLARKIRCLSLVLVNKEMLNAMNKSYSFSGFAELVENGITREIIVTYANGKLLGKTQDNSFDLAYAMKHDHDGKIFIWGQITYDADKKSHYGYVYIPKGFNSEELKEIEKLYHFIECNKEIITAGYQNSTDILSYLHNQQEIERIHKSLGEPDELFLPFKKSMLSSFTKNLELEEKWQELIKLESYSAFIGRLRPLYANAIWKRIELAKSKLAINQSKYSSDIFKNNTFQLSTSVDLPLEKKEWETPRAYWSNFPLPGYRYSEKKKAWWKQKN